MFPSVELWRILWFPLPFVEWHWFVNGPDVVHPQRLFVLFTVLAFIVAYHVVGFPNTDDTELAVAPHRVAGPTPTILFDNLLVVVCLLVLVFWNVMAHNRAYFVLHLSEFVPIAVQLVRCIWGAIRLLFHDRHCHCTSWRNLTQCLLWDLVEI